MDGARGVRRPFLVEPSPGILQQHSNGKRYVETHPSRRAWRLTRYRKEERSGSEVTSECWFQPREE